MIDTQLLSKHPISCIEKYVIVMSLENVHGNQETKDYPKYIIVIA